MPIKIYFFTINDYINGFAILPLILTERIYMKKLENLEAIGLIAVVLINKIILNFPKLIIKQSGSSAWISTILISLIAIFFAWLISHLLKPFPNQDILDVSNYLVKNKLKNIIGILHILFLITISALVLRNFAESLKIIYFPSSPLIFLLLFFIVSACISNQFDLKTISKANLIIAPIIFISILIIFGSTSKNFVFQRLLPIFGDGAKQTFFSNLANVYGFTGLAYLLYLKPFLKNEKDFSKISIVSIAFSSIFLFLSVVCLLLVFSFVTNSNESMSIYLLSKTIRYGEFIQRANALFIFVWILSILSYCSIVIFFIIYITKKITNVSNTQSINYCFGSIIFGCSLLYENVSKYIDFIDNFLKYVILIFLFGINVFILFLANLKLKKQKGIL